VISWFDLRSRQIPHYAWAAIPFLISSGYRILNGGWGLTLLSILMVIVSERKFVSNYRFLKPLASIYTWMPIIGLATYIAGSNNLIGSLAVLGFWIAWELRVWGGADGMAAITLIQIWPDAPLLISFILVNLTAAISVTSVTLVHERKLRMHQMPGLPLLLFSMIGRFILIGFYR
jgi:hypothetical protein